MRREDISFPFSFSLSCWWFGSYLYIRSLDDDDEGMINRAWQDSTHTFFWCMRYVYFVIHMPFLPSLPVVVVGGVKIIGYVMVLCRQCHIMIFNL